MNKKAILVTGLILSMFLLIFVFVSTFSGAEDTLPTLTIVAPSQVNETESFDVMVLSNGIPVENANVTFYEQSKKTNSSGMVRFAAPSVLPDTNNTYNITVSKVGYISNQTSIKILNIPQLYLHVLGTLDGRVFTKLIYVTVIDDSGNLIENATITLNNESYTTDKYGNVTIITPNFKTQMSILIFVQKIGYKSDSSLITIYPMDQDVFPDVICYTIFLFIIIIIILFIWFVIKKGKK
jgi:hypothetical protein